MKNVFNVRYKKQNVERMKQNFFSKNYKKILSQNLLLAPILVPIMAIRKIYWHLENSKLHTLHFYNLAQKPLLMPYFALLYACKKILKILNAIFDIIPKMIVNIRLLRGKVDIPYFELVLTTRCSLRCESCNNLMQYFDSKNAYTCSLQGIIDAVSAILDKIDCVRNVRIIGGEPLLFKDIAKVVEFLDSKKKVRSFDIVTNGSIVPKNDLLLALAKSDKSSITISDYSASPNIKIPLHYDKIIDLLKSHNIPHSILWQDKTEWINPQKIYKRGRSKGEIIRNFKACLMPCVSVMSNEMGVAKNQIVKNQIGGGQIDISAEKSQNLAHFKVDSAKCDENCIDSKGQIFICPIASSLSRLKGLDEFSGDFLSLDSALNGDKIIDFYKQDFFSVCDYCRDMWEKGEKIAPAIQTTKTLKVEK